MEVQYYGANCVRIITKRASVIIDDNLDELGRPSQAKKDEIAIFTGSHASPKATVKLVIDQPGEYEVSDVSVRGIAARAHIDEPGQQSATMYRIIADDMRIGVTGHIYPELSEAQLEAMGTIDLLFVPVGGSGFTLDAVGALQVIKKIEPKIIIPTYYADDQMRFPVPPVALPAALKEMSMEPKETASKLKMKTTDLIGDTTQMIVLERQ